MHSRWDSFLRIVARLAQFLAVVFSIALVAGVLAIYLAAFGNQPRLLHKVVRTLGEPFSAQRTEHIEVSAQVLPGAQRLSASATLTLRSLEEKRSRFLFLLNPLLKLRSIRLNSPDASDPLSVYRLAWIVIVEPKEPVAKDHAISVTFDYEGIFPATFADPIPSEISAHRVLLGPESFWYPTDAQSFFTADVRVTMPRSLTVVHNSPKATRVERGDLQVVHWTSTRPIGSIPIVAGRFHSSEVQTDDINYRLYLAEDVTLDSERILSHMSRTNRFFGERFGASGFDSVSVYVDRDLRRGVNYGSGLIGMPLRYFRSGDDGFALLAHEIAHNWWGGTVAEQWLRPGTGGQWIVEGLAELSSLVATEEAFGVDALTRRMASQFFDPDKQRALRDMSMLDNVLSEAATRDTIYRKGSYVAYRLCSQLGRDRCFSALRTFVEKHRYTQTSDADLQKVFEEVAGRSLDGFFADWVRSDALADINLSASDSGEIVVQSQGKARTDSETLALWVFRQDNPEPTVTSAQIGDKFGLPTGQYAIIDPQLFFPDVIRSNNRYPQLANPLFVTAGTNNQLLITTGEPWPWAAQTITVRSAAANKQSWQLPRGTLQPPAWFPDGAQVLVSYADPDHSLPTILALAVDGTRRTVGRGTSPALASDGSVYTARKTRVVRIAADGSESVLAQRSGWVLDQPLPSPTGNRFAYLAARHNHLEIHIAEEDGSRDRVLLTWDRDRTLLRWAPAGDKLYALLGGNWDWQILEIPLAEGATRVLVRDATAIGDFAISPDGSLLALTAAPEPDYPIGRKHLYVLALSAGAQPRHIEVADTDLHSLAWDGSDKLLVVGRHLPSGQPWIFPQAHVVKVVALGDGSIQDLAHLP